MVDFKKRGEGGKTKEKDIMKRRGEKDGDRRERKKKKQVRRL